MYHMRTFSLTPVSFLFRPSSFLLFPRTRHTPTMKKTCTHNLPYKHTCATLYTYSKQILQQLRRRGPGICVWMFHDKVYTCVFHRLFARRLDPFCTRCDCCFRRLSRASKLDIPRTWPISSNVKASECPAPLTLKVMCLDSGNRSSALPRRPCRKPLLVPLSRMSVLTFAAVCACLCCA